MTDTPAPVLPPVLPPAMTAELATSIQTASDVDYGKRAHRAAEKHLEALQIAYYAEEDGEEDLATWPEAMAGPYCACAVCDMRELLFAAAPHLMECALRMLMHTLLETDPSLAAAVASHVDALIAEVHAEGPTPTEAAA